MGRNKRICAAVAAAAASAAIALAGCGPTAPASSGSGAGGTASAVTAEANPNVDPGTPLGGKPAPGFRLVNQFGQPMSLSQFRGKVVLLSFDDAVCTTVCPLTTAEMLEAKQLLGAAGDQVQLLGVNANPVDTAVSYVMAYSRAHGMVNQWDFLTGSTAQLQAVWKKYAIYAQVEAGVVDHTPALYVIDRNGREQMIYLTQMAYAGTRQQAQILAQEISGLLPGRPALARQVPLSDITGQSPKQTVTMPSAGPSGSQVTLRAGQPHLVVFFATWLSETSDLKSELTALNAYVATARQQHLPPLTAVDETVTEPDADAVTRYLDSLGTPLRYPVGKDTTGRIADGYGVQDQPWFVLTSASGNILWHHDGWVSPASLAAAVRQHAAR